MRRVAVIGAGSWGTALAALLAKKGREVRLWAFEPEVAEEIQGLGQNRTYLPDVKLPLNLECTADLETALSGAGVVLSVSPSQFVGSVMSEAAAYMEEDVLVVSASKGIETSTLRRMDEVLTGVLSPRQMAGFCALSGPSFAREVAEEAPTAVAVASRSENAARQVQELFQTGYFRVYTGVDVIGVELGGALKNVIALGAGVTAGLGFGHNTLAALVTRGLAEIRQARGGHGSTGVHILRPRRHGRPRPHLYGVAQQEPHGRVSPGSGGDARDHSRGHDRCGRRGEDGAGGV